MTPLAFAYTAYAQGQRWCGAQQSSLPQTVASKRFEVCLSSADWLGIWHIVVTHGDKTVQQSLSGLAWLSS